ncbi:MULTISPECIES: hypothetical protein [unclassified Nocardia]|uniref:hypothetical protein n=1 Tax=unclassified Nocardia TaxID=2637762 RepID=UPI001CE48987|nr:MULTISPECIES: hypothetical protein [unclassified Nocardia]
MNGVVRLRLCGDLGDITAVLAVLVGTEGLLIDVGDLTYPNRGGNGVRVYAELAVPAVKEGRG